LREGVLFEPTVANTAHWNPLSILEMGFTPYTVQGVLPTLTGKGCYSTTCSTAPPGLGRCYSHHCSRTLTKKSGLPPPTLPTSSGKSTDWKSFWNLDDEFLKTCQKNEIKRQNVIFEFVQSEEEYVTDLNTMLSLFQKQILSSASSQLPIIPRGRMDNFVKVVFGNVKPILDWQVKKLLTPLRERQAQQGPVVKGLGDIILEWVRGCRLIYADYAGGYPFADNLVREETTTNSTFASWLEVYLYFAWVDCRNVKRSQSHDDFPLITFYKLRIERFSVFCFSLKGLLRILKKPIEIGKPYRKLRMNLRRLSMNVMLGTYPAGWC
jgi:hypothetical protein